MPSKIFISYRRDEAKWQAREIYRALTAVLPKDHVFMDIDSIPPGADFVKILEGEVGRCDILLALIGPGWIDASDPKTGKRRLENPEDFVRIEVRKGLKRGIPVVPVLLDGAPIPEAARLPNDLKPLARRHAELIEHRSVDADVERLIRRLNLSSTTVAGAADRSPARPAPSLEECMRAEGRIFVDAPIVENPSGKWFKPGNGKTEWFMDHKQGPEMVVVPAGKFSMGSPDREPERGAAEGPRHDVTIAAPFAVGRHAVTRGQFAAFMNDTGHELKSGASVCAGNEWKQDREVSWRNPGFAQDDSHPVVCVSWDDAKAYAIWLADITGKTYRLPSEAEREYVTRAATTTPFWWGSSITSQQANYNGKFSYPSGSERGKWRQATVPVDSFKANPWGLYNVHGNVWEWCEDVWHTNYNGAPADVSAWLEGGVQDRRVVRGGSWNYDPVTLRSAHRNRSTTGYRNFNLGFRVARTLTS